jgi:hypothetical protein
VSSVKFEVWMPVSNWNGKFLVNGFAFYGGTMAPAPLAGALRLGYATATTDLGGDGTNSAAYLTGHPESLKDWENEGGMRRRSRLNRSSRSYNGTVQPCPIGIRAAVEHDRL